MGTLLIDKLLQTVCTQKASDLHLTVGSQPVIRLHGTIMSGGGQFRPSLSLASTAWLIEKAFAYNDAPAVAISISRGHLQSQ